MAYTPARLCGPAFLTGAAADVYTAAGRSVLVQSVLAVNGSAAPVTVRLNLVPAGGSADGSNLILPDVPVDGHDLLTFSDPWMVMAPGDRLNGLASTAGVLVLTVSGVLL